jgi:hypothetical protein
MSDHSFDHKREGAPGKESAFKKQSAKNLSHKVNGGNRIDFDAINAELLSDYLAVLTRWLPNGRREGSEYCVGSLAGEPGNSLKINWRTGVWTDFASGEKGGSDPVSLFAAIHGLSQAEAAKRLGGFAVCMNHAVVPSRHQAQELLRMPGDFRTGTRQELQTVADLRRVDFWPVATAQQNRVLRFGTVCGFPCWIVTDESQKVAEARRMDGLMFPGWGSLGERKAHTLRGSSKAWPAGLMMPNNLTSYFQKVLLVEGSADLLAACHFVHNGTQDWLPVAMLGASSKLAAEALLMLKGKRVRIVPHVDKPGEGAARSWGNQLRAAGITADWFKLGGLRKASGEAVKDLNDCTDIHAGDAAELEGLLK